VIGVDAGMPAVPGELAATGVELHLDEQGLALLERVRAVVKSPGVGADAPVVAAARERGLPVLGELELAWRMLANEFLAVTGTNGKTTTVELIGHIHREAARPVAVAGNVGTAACSLVGHVDLATTVVCEVSSFQLEDTLCFAPEAAVLLNVSPDHLDRHASMEAYLAAKLEIFARQDEQDIAVAPVSLLGGGGRPQGADLPALADRTAPLGRAELYAFGAGSRAAMSAGDGQLRWRGHLLLETSELRLRGRHNVENAMAAAAVCLASGLGREAVRAGLRSFPGVPHRLEEVANRGGVLFVNDSKATNVASTLVALDAFTEPASAKRIHLILGGQGKGQDFGALSGPVGRSCRAVYLIGEDSPLIASALAGVDTEVRACGELERALAGAAQAAVAGEVVLLSPACASFDQFADFQARGDRFRELVGNGGFAARVSK